MILAEDGEDTEERRFRWPSSISIGIQRAQDILHHEERLERSLPSLPFLPNLGSCNYNSEPGLSCADCSNARLCLPNNVSITTNCGVLLPNCNGGLCSSTPNRNCSENST
ncbi:unnamed protein product [Pieris macdunnoughi]|nr:unnamed protein product [Pieris macdunnoughi]